MSKMLTLISTHDANGWSLDEQHHISTNFRFSFHQPEDGETFISAIHLLTGEGLQQFLDKIGPLVGSKSRAVTASLFMKRYAYCSLTSALYGMTLLNKTFDMKCDNVGIIHEEHHQMWLPSFTLKDTSAYVCDGPRDEWRAAVIETLFKENISVMVNHIEKVARVPKVTLWENCWVYVKWLYNTWSNENHPPKMKEQILADFHFMKTTTGTLFGLRQNPFQNFVVRDLVKNANQRQTCCLYYKTENGVCCKTCPKKQ